jgi:two-component system osmolarity sensor histidine kinase EnvZ
MALLRRLWPDSLFTRMLLTQALLVAAAVLIFSVILNFERLILMAPPYAALGAPALRQVATSAVGSPAVPAKGLLHGIRREAGPPAGFSIPAFLRPTRALREELVLHGIQMDKMRAVDCGRRCNLWAEVRVDGGEPVWVSLNGLPFVETWSARAFAGLLLLLVVVAVVTRYFARRVTQPLARLHDRMLSHAHTGAALPPSAAEERWPPPPELQAMDRAYTQLAEKLARNERERALLLAGVSHDLRSPLARIRLVAELLPETPDLHEAMAAVTRNVDHADRLIGSFLEFVRTSTQALDETVDAAAMARQAVAGFNLPTRDLVAQLPERLLLHGASSLLLERLVVNLVENALKHGGMPVQVHLACVGDTMELTVVDAGPGLPEGGAERLMEAFARGDAARGVPGFGLGLAIVQQIVTRLEGRLLFERSPVGHRVQVVVPLGR